MSARGAIAARPAWAEGAVVRATVFAVVRSQMTQAFGGGVEARCAR